ncbi:MAG: glucose-6-phosphate isomerase, partial [Pseudomonadota bacterium]
MCSTARPSVRFTASPAAIRSRSASTLDDLAIDLSKERLDTGALAALVALARAAGVEALRDRMAAGEAVNLTEGRAVLHMALR